MEFLILKKTLCYLFGIHQQLKKMIRFLNLFNQQNPFWDFQIKGFLVDIFHGFILTIFQNLQPGILFYYLEFLLQSNFHFRVIKANYY